jgi:hypothetical protein
MSDLRMPLLVVLATLFVACAAVLGLRAPGSMPFEHRAHVLKGVNCLECHRGVSSAADLGPMHLPETSDCVACHENPHDPKPCGQCHGSAHIRAQVMVAREHLKFEHASHDVATQGKCVRCHLDVSERDGPLRPAMATCFGCHEHEKQWQVTDCDGCHVDLQMEHVLPASHVIHGPDFMREHGARAASEDALCSSCHTDRTCAGCHGATVAALPARLAFAEPERADMHRAGFMARHALEARSDPALCTTCHTESSCTSCHDREGVIGRGARSPHPPGWVGLPGSRNTHGPAARMDPVSCASCHGGAGEALCVGCHRVGGAGGNPHPPGFSSHRAKSEQPCRMCHLEAL